MFSRDFRKLTILMAMGSLALSSEVAFAQSRHGSPAVIGGINGLVAGALAGEAAARSAGRASERALSDQGFRESSSQLHVSTVEILQRICEHNSWETERCRTLGTSFARQYEPKTNDVMERARFQAGLIQKLCTSEELHLYSCLVDGALKSEIPDVAATIRGCTERKLRERPIIYYLDLLGGEYGDAQCVAEQLERFRTGRPRTVGAAAGVSSDQPLASDRRETFKVSSQHDSSNQSSSSSAGGVR